MILYIFICIVNIYILYKSHHEKNKITTLNCFSNLKYFLYISTISHKTRDSYLYVFILLTIRMYAQNPYNLCRFYCAECTHRIEYSVVKG